MELRKTFCERFDQRKNISKWCTETVSFERVGYFGVLSWSKGEQNIHESDRLLSGPRVGKRVHLERGGFFRSWTRSSVLEYITTGVERRSDVFCAFLAQETASRVPWS